MSDLEYMQRVRGMEGRLYRIAQAILWREADSVDAVQEAVFRGWMKKDRLKAARSNGGKISQTEEGWAEICRARECGQAEECRIIQERGALYEGNESGIIEY